MNATIARAGGRPAGWLVACLLALACGAPEATSPDVVMVVVDSLRADHVSHLGYERKTAPALDAFRDRATLFSSAWAASPNSVPSTASLLTGLAATRHGATGADRRLPSAATTLAEILRDHGWSTAALSYNPMVSRRFGLDQGFDRFEGTLGKPTDYPDVRDAIDWLREWLASEATSPFFLYMHVMNVHGPYRVPPDRRSALLGRPPGAGIRYGGPLMRQILDQGRLMRRSAVSEKAVRGLVDQYDTAIRYTTDRLAEVLELLEHSGSYDGALIVLTSDHGEELFEHGGFAHGYTLHREVLHVPLYIKRPQQRVARTVDVPVSLLDVFPTVLDEVGIGSAGFDSDGRSLAPLLRDGAAEPDDRVLLHELAWEERGAARATSDGRYRLIQIQSDYEGKRGARELYDPILDRHEKRNLASRRPQVAARLEERLEQVFAELESRRLEDP